MYSVDNAQYNALLSALLLFLRQTPIWIFSLLVADFYQDIMTQMPHSPFDNKL